MLGESMFIIMKYQLDWAATGAMLQGVGSILGGVAIIIAAYLGSNTYNNWRKQKLFERKIEYAEKILTSTYKVRRELSYVRSPFITSQEYHMAENKLKDIGEWDKISSSEYKKYKKLYTYYNRLNDAIEARKELEECYSIARAVFSEDLDKALQELNKQFHLVQIYAESEFDDTGNDIEFTKIIRMHLCESNNPQDDEIKNLIEKIEGYCIPILKIA